MISIDRLPSYVDIGFTGEKDFRKVEVDFSAWEALLSEGVPAAIHQLPGRAAYKPTISCENNVLTWTIDQEDLGSTECEGLLQFEYVKGDTVIKSPIVKTRIHQGIMR